MYKRVIMTVGMVLFGLAAFFVLRGATPICACGEFDSISSSLSAQPPGANDSIPAPTGPVVLTLTGKIGMTNAEGRLDFDRATLMRMTQIGYQVDDQHLKRPIFYQGVELAGLLKRAHVAADATTLRAVTRDGDTIDLPIEVPQWQVMIALERFDTETGDSGAIEIPLQLVSPSLQIEQLRSLEVR